VLPPDFDPAYYLMVHGDVAEAGMDPAEHYVEFGRHEGRTGVPPGSLHPLERELHDRFDFFTKAFSAISVNGVEGDYLEFGTAHGKTLWCAWKASRAVGLQPRLWAFDSFKGLPAPDNPVDRAHPAWRSGRYAVTEEQLRTNLRRMRVPDHDVVTVPGFFSESLTKPGLPERVALAYVDCDMYSSTVDVLRYLGDIVTHGSIVAFDDWFCWSSTSRSGEQQALEEFTGDRPGLVFNPHLPIGWHGMAFFVTHP
jgi:hypothetical protein